MSPKAEDLLGTEGSDQKHCWEERAYAIFIVCALGLTVPVRAPDKLLMTEVLLAVILMMLTQLHGFSST